MESQNGIEKHLALVKIMSRFNFYFRYIYMSYHYLSITSSVLVVVGYVPEIYFIIIYKKSKKSNIPIWLIWTISSGLGVLYCGLNNNYLIMINFILNFFFCSLSLLLNIYFLYSNNSVKNTVKNEKLTIEYNCDIDFNIDIENNNSIDVIDIDVE